MMNKVALAGLVCREPVYRVTPLGRKYTELLIAVERLSGTYDYITCILWGRSAENAKTLEIGAPVEVNGRLQSRILEKKLKNGETEKRLTYDVCVNSFQIVDGEDGV